MSLYSVLDQAAILESFLAGIIEYFEWTYQQVPIPETHLGNFMPVVTLVEDWFKKDEKSRSKLGASTEYQDEFDRILKHAM